MFPEDFVRKHVFAYTDRDDVIFDPFSGRGTTVFESLSQGRIAAGTDINPVAACLSNAKADPPTLVSALERLRHLKKNQMESSNDLVLEVPFFQLCFDPETLSDLIYLRSVLDWRNCAEDRFIAAVILGCLQGDPSRTQYCFSNRMPRTISTKLGYSVRWWRSRGLQPPKRDVFEIVRHMLHYRFASKPPKKRGFVAEIDARKAASVFPKLARKVKLVITSPPYLDTTHYQEDQWLRLWFLGGEPKPVRCGGDDRHTSADKYWQFLTQSWAGVRNLLASNSTIVIRIGAKHVEKHELRKNLVASLNAGLNTKVKMLGNGITSTISRPQTRTFRPGAEGTKLEHDFCFRVG